jgi:hypothetical protein
MRTVTIDIINEKALSLLRDMEGLRLIRLHSDQQEEHFTKISWAKYKGAMNKQAIDEIDQQLNELRNEWE